VNAGTLRDLHQRRPLVLPNVWDAASARAFAAAGFPALATSSGAVANVLGHEDHEQAPVDEVLAAIARITQSVDIPVTADFESGYGLTPGEIVNRLLEAGAVGCNLEDTDHAVGAPRPVAVQAERLGTVVEIAAGRLVVNARVDTYWSGVDAVPAGTVGSSSETPTVVIVVSMAGLMTSSNGCGKKPNSTIASTSGATAPTSRRSRSTIVSRPGRTGPVIVRWYMSRT